MRRHEIARITPFCTRRTVSMPWLACCHFYCRLLLLLEYRTLSGNTMTVKPDITASFTSFLRKSAQLTCHFDGCGEKFADKDERIKAHFLEKHKDALDSSGTPLADAISQCRRSNQTNPARGSRAWVLRPSHSPPLHTTNLTRDQSGQSGGSTPAQDDHTSTQPLASDVAGDERSPKRVKSPEKQQVRPRSNSPVRRSRALAATGPQDLSFGRRVPSTTTQGKKLWTPDQPVTGTSSPRVKPLNKGKTSEGRSRPARMEDFSVEEEPATPLIKQPETRPISQEQLVAEVKGIYAGLVMVESKCIEVDNAQSSQNESKLNNEQWQALIALHRTLLHEHHDFFLASQHPSASPALRRLASKYAMPARMWRHGIHSFLELLRHRLPASLEHMLTFIYLAYSMMALLYETVPAFEDTWIECLGDLGRYRLVSLPPVLAA